MSWFKKLLPKVSTTEKKGVPEGVWNKCEVCEAILYRAELEKHLYVCPKCNHHMRLSARERLRAFFDEGEQIEIAQEMAPIDYLKFRDTKKYKERIIAAQKSSGENEALVVMKGMLEARPIVAAAFEFAFIGGSMSSAVGARFIEGIEVAMASKTPFVCFSTSGGARMQEGLFSLFQMARTSAALTRLAKVHLPYISVLIDPTMGGVSASLATLGDIIIAEPQALIGFSGPRVIEQTIRQKLPEGFQRSEFLLEHGAIDMIVDRREMRSVIAKICAMLMNEHVR